LLTPDSKRSMSGATAYPIIGSTTSSASLLDSTGQRKRLQNMELCARTSWMSEANSVDCSSAARTNVSVASGAVIAARSAFDQLPEFAA